MTNTASVISAGDEHALAIGSNDSVYAWGYGADGQLGKHHQRRAARSGLLQQRDHASQRPRTAVGPLVRAHLGGGDAKDAAHGAP